MAKILYIGDSSEFSTSMHRARALERLGHQVILEDLSVIISNNSNSTFKAIFHYRTGYSWLQKAIAFYLNEKIQSFVEIDFIWVDDGQYIGLKALRILKKINCPIILYNVDDPTGKRDACRFGSLLKSIPFFDLIAVVRKETEMECIKLGAKNVHRFYRSYDEVAHKPYDNMSEIPQKLKSDVAFIGTWMRYEKRDEFILELINNGINVSIWGDRWQKSPHWKQLKSNYHGAPLTGRDYVAAIQGAKICLGLLSKGNRDLHTTRSLEVPYAGGLLCAQRTSEHLEIYKEGVEAVFWADALECASLCKMLLKDDNLREKIRLAGMKKVRGIELGNEDICKKIIQNANALKFSNH